MSAHQLWPPFRECLCLRVCVHVYKVTLVMSTLCNPVDWSSLGPSVHGILQARSGLPFPSPGNLPDPGIEPVSLTSLALAGEFFTTSTIWEA